ncbi:MAG: hypothetical protein PVG64_05630, partial [Syntrophobacterales bacterium]
MIDLCLPSQFVLVSRMKMPSWCLFSRSEAHGLVTSNPAVTGGRHPLPVPRSWGTGPGAPPDTAG